jgi:hypothetical protein
MSNQDSNILPLQNRIVNLCPHSFDLYDKATDKLVLRVPPSGTVCNVEFKHEKVNLQTTDVKAFSALNIPVFYIPTQCQSVSGLPSFEDVKSKNLLLFVSSVVEQAISTSLDPIINRYKDFIITATLDREMTKRNEKGMVIGAYSVSIPMVFY